MKTILIFIAALLAASLTVLHAADGSRKSNIVLIVADDLGYGDVSAYGCKEFATPHLDSIAKAGMRFTSGYVTAPVCGPSRAALLTGRHNCRILPFEGNPPPGSDTGLPLAHKTMADHLKAAGYRTAALGKWHLGETPQHHPMSRGFDEFFGFLSGMHSYFKAEDAAWGPLLRGREKAELKDYLTFALADEACAIIRRPSPEPFFLYLAFNAPHVPLEAPENYLAKTAHLADPKRRLNAAMILALDDAVGRVLAVLRESGRAENTLIVFLSDNGAALIKGSAENGGSNGPLRGSKAQLWEGGIRVPFFVQWPGRIAAGGVSDTPVSSLDVLPTVLAAAESSHHAPRNESLDGLNLLPWLEGKTEPPAREHLFWKFGANQMAIRGGDMKLVRVNADRGLFNVRQDISETTDRTEARPILARQLEAAWKKWDAGNLATKRPPRAKQAKQSGAVVGIEQEGGVWWFRSPAGKRFLSIGMNHVEPVYWMSPNNKQFVLETYGRDLFLPDGQFNDGSQAARKWAARVAVNLKAWGFNTLGMHNPPLESLRSAGDVYYVVELGLHVPWGWNMKRSELIQAFGRRPLDIFSDAFAAEVQSNAAQCVKPVAGNLRVLGYAYSDGPPWTVDDDVQDAVASLHPWVLALMSLPADAKGKQAWLATMKDRYASAVTAGATYGRNTPTWDELAAITSWTSVSDKTAAAADSDAFLEKLMRQWYEFRRSAIRAHDQHHLILGDKLNSNRDARHREAMTRTLRVMKDYVDVIFIQYYASADQQRDTLAAIYQAAQKPILIGDTACRPLWKDNDPTNVTYYGELGQVYADDLTKLLSLPYLIGWHHCGYMRGLRPPYVAALKRGDRQTIEHHVKTKTTLREGFITEVEAPIEPLLKPLRLTISKCESLHRASAAADTPAEIPGVKAVLAHIQKGFPQSIKVDKTGNADIVGLPHPYTSPCIKEGFQQLFYWDTYFINQGLLRVGLAEQARNNVDNLLLLTDQFGIVPSASRRSMANRSQTPFLSQMVRDIYEHKPDEAWLRFAYATLKKDYDFWMTKRLAPCGLNRSGNDATEQYLMAFYHYLARERFKGLALATKEEQLAFSRQALSEAETWDFTPRYDRRAEDFCPVDQNSNLYIYEMNFAWFTKLLNNGEEQAWLAKAEKRKALIQELLWNETLGCYTDYDWKNRRHGDLVSCAALYPLVAGIASPQQAEKVAAKMRAVLECDHGLATCEKRVHPFIYQWDYPNAWPPLQMLAIQALDRYGFKADARRIAEKYVRTVVRNFEKTGDLWEKYNAVTGTIEVKDEYQMPRMMGWTAGVFVFATDYLSPTKAEGESKR